MRICMCVNVRLGTRGCSLCPRALMVRSSIFLATPASIVSEVRRGRNRASTAASRMVSAWFPLRHARRGDTKRPAESTAPTPARIAAAPLMLGGDDEPTDEVVDEGAPRSSTNWGDEPLLVDP